MSHCTVFLECDIQLPRKMFTISSCSEVTLSPLWWDLWFLSKTSSGFGAHHRWCAEDHWSGQRMLILGNVGVSKSEAHFFFMSKMGCADVYWSPVFCFISTDNYKSTTCYCRMICQHISLHLVEIFILLEKLGICCLKDPMCPPKPMNCNWIFGPGYCWTVSHSPYLGPFFSRTIMF